MEIPKIFYQSWDIDLPESITTENNKFIPRDFEYKRFSLDNIRDYLKNNWGNNVVSVYDNYKIIPHKIDLWRYCILYDTGGIYMDADCILLDNIDSIIKNCNCFFTINNRGVKDVFNGFLGTFPKNPIYKEIIDYMLRTKNNFKKDYFFNCKELYNIISRNIDLEIYKYNDYLFKENIIIGSSNTNIKSMFLNKNIKNIEFDKNTFLDNFEYTHNNNILTIKRTDKDSGWGQNLKAKIYYEGINIKILWDSFLEDNICTAYYDNKKIMIEKNPLYPYPKI
jgi:hypothetical protein